MEKEILQPAKIIIEQAPKNLNLKDIEVNENQCFLNSFRIAEKNPSVRIVEGIIIICDDKKHGTAKAHAWNELDSVHFDLTAECVWPKGEETGIVEVKYASLKFHLVEELQKTGVLEFCSETNENVDAINSMIGSDRSPQ